MLANHWPGPLPYKKHRETRLCFWTSRQVGPPPSTESRAVLGLTQVRTTEQPRTAQLRAPHQCRSWGDSLHLRALPLSSLLFYHLASTFQLGSPCCQFSWKKLPISWRFSKERGRKRKEKKGRGLADALGQGLYQLSLTKNKALVTASSNEAGQGLQKYLLQSYF